MVDLRTEQAINPDASRQNRRKATQRGEMLAELLSFVKGGAA